MPIKIISKTYTDDFGVSNSFLKNNAGDGSTALIKVESSIRLTSQNNPLTLDYTTLEVTSSESWLDEGFRLGDLITSKRYNQFGGIMATWTAFVTYVDDTTLRLNQQFGWYIQSSQEYQTLEVTGRNRESVDLYFNMTKNGITGNDFSLIDGEATLARVENISSLSVGGTTNALLVGKQSGSALSVVGVERLADINGAYVYEFSFIFYNTGFYNLEWFTSSGCLKMYIRSAWATLNNEPYSRTVVTINDDANTGWFNEPNNTSQVDSVLVAGIDELDYSLPSTFDIVVDGTTANIGIGGCYLSIDDTYYKNRTFSQKNVAILQKTENIAITPKTSFNSPTGANYQITINSAVSVGSVTTINVTFTPNTAFTDFMEAQEEDNRLFYLWVRVGNTNHLAFADQLTVAPPVGGLLDILNPWEFFDHSHNITEATQGVTRINITDKFDTEDDLAFYGTFLLDNLQVYDRFNVRIEAYNTVTLEDFTLQQSTFDFSGVQISNIGQYLLDETALVVGQLPNTSVKRNAIFKREPSVDAGSQYGVSIYYPTLLRWETWLSQLNSSVDFYPNQNKNWQQYSDNGNWVVRLELELIKEGLAYVFSKEIIDYTYDNEPVITTTIELIRELDATVVDVVPIGEMMRIRATSVLSSGAWNDFMTWAMITVEPFESSPRSICSSTVDFDNNNSNPLMPESGLLMPIVFDGAGTAVYECLFDSNKIDLSNGLSITAKIKDTSIVTPSILKTTAPDDSTKTTSSEGFLSYRKTLS